MFLRSRRGLPHQHVGTVHADDAGSAVILARAAFVGSAPDDASGAGNGPGADHDPGALWVVPTSAVTPASPERRAALFDPAADKPFRHPAHYAVPDGVMNL